MGSLVDHPPGGRSSRRPARLSQKHLASSRALGMHSLTNLSTFAPPCAARDSMTVQTSRLLRLVGMPLICLTFFALSGGHWAVFQAIAWAQMIRDYSRTATIAEAIAKTFNGRSPCGMCTKISEERQKENSAPATAKFEKKKRFFSWACTLSTRGRVLRITDISI
jgi:hypothetical protein